MSFTLTMSNVIVGRSELEHRDPERRWRASRGGQRNRGAAADGRRSQHAVANGGGWRAGIGMNDE